MTRLKGSKIDSVLMETAAIEVELREIFLQLIMVTRLFVSFDACWPAGIPCMVHVSYFTGYFTKTIDRISGIWCTYQQVCNVYLVCVRVV